jgi:hypothetical protein
MSTCLNLAISSFIFVGFPRSEFYTPFQEKLGKSVARNKAGNSVQAIVNTLIHIIQKDLCKLGLIRNKQLKKTI